VDATYKYSIVDVDEDLLNTLGAQGWRVAHVIPPTGDDPARLLLELRDDDEDEVVIDKDAVGRMLGDLFGGRGLPST
jgi:hypothetical protein